MAEQQVEARDQEHAGPIPDGPAVDAPSFGGSSIRAHEQAILSLQQTAGNRAVTGLLSGVQRAPLAAPSMMHRALAPGPLQRAPADTDVVSNVVKGRVDRIRQAIGYSAMPIHMMMVKIEPLAEALSDMTSDEGRQVRQEFEKRYGWNLKWLIGGHLEIGGKPVHNDIGPMNRRRLLNLLDGTRATEVDPLASYKAGEGLGQLVGSFVGKREELGRVVGKATQIAGEDRRVEDEKQAAARRRTAQAIQMKAWMDTGKVEQILKVLRSLSTPARRDERAALDEAYRVQFGDTLYIALTKRFKDPFQWQRIGALWDFDTAKDDRLATEAKVDKVKKAEAAAPKLAPWVKPSTVPKWALSKDYQKGQKRIRDERAALEAHLDELQSEPASPGGTEGKSRLEAAIGDTPGATIRRDVAASTGLDADELVARDKRPLVLASRLARAYREKALKPSDVEGALREVRSAAIAEAERRAAAATPDNPAPEPESIIDGYFTQFTARFEAEAKRPLLYVLSSIGSAEDRNRNLALLLREGHLPEWAELHLAIRSEHKDMERVRAILEPKTRTQILELAGDYRRGTGRDMSEDLLGKPDYVRMLKHPNAADVSRKDRPSDLRKARKELAEKEALLRGQAEATEQSTYVKEQKALGSQLAAAVETADRGGMGAPPVPKSMVSAIVSDAQRADARNQLHDEARFVLGRISGREIRTMYNRGLFALARDDVFGNVEHGIVNQTKRDALAALALLDAALLKDPPDLDTAQDQVNELYLVEARMKHNLNVYEERTQEAFNAFVDAAVFIATTLATMGQGGPILMAIRATAATVATKATLKGPDYSATEFWGDIKGGVYSAIGGKLSDELVGGVANAIAVRYAKRAKDIALPNKWGTWLAANAGKAARWEADNLVSGAISGGLEAAETGDASKLTGQIGLESHKMALAQAGIHGGKRTLSDARAKAKAGVSRRQAPPRRASAPGGTPTRADGTVGGSVSGGGRSTDGEVLRAVSATSGAAAVPGGPNRPAREQRGLPDLEVPLRPDEFEVPPATMTAAELGMKPEHDEPRRVRNRQEQLRREGLLPGPDGVAPGPQFDAHLLEASTGPTGGRRFAAEFTPIREGWLHLPVDVRAARVEAVVNRILADAGMPRVTVVSDATLAAGNAGFSPVEWKITISEGDLLDPSPEGFGDLANAVAHETRHALHIFRGVRAALHANPAFSAPVRADVLQRAGSVNRIGGFDEKFRLPDRNRPGDRGSEAYGEAVDVIQEAFGPGTPDRPTAVGAGMAARDRSNELATALDEHRNAMAAKPFDAARVQRAEQAVVVARRRELEAHNVYVKTAPEADAHRAGPAAAKATVERLQLEQQVIDAESFATRASADLDAAVLSGDAGRIERAIARAQQLQARVRDARAALDALTPSSPVPDAASLGAEPVVPRPAEFGEVLPVPAPGGAAQAQGRSRTASVTQRGAAGPGRAPAGPLRSVRPVGDRNGGASTGPRPAGDGGSNEAIQWVTERPGPRLKAAQEGARAAEAARVVAENRLNQVQSMGGDVRAAESELTRARELEGIADEALRQARDAAVRELRVTQGIEQSGASYARRAERSKVEAIDDPDVAARMFLDQGGPANGSLAIGRRDVFVSQWRYGHHQQTEAPLAGWRRSDGTVVIDRSNPKVAEAVERLARERSGGRGGSGSSGGG